MKWRWVLWRVQFWVFVGIVGYRLAVLGGRLAQLAERRTMQTLYPELMRKVDADAGYDQSQA